MEYYDTIKMMAFKYVNMEKYPHYSNLEGKDKVTV